MKILAIDFGSKRIGLAIGDTLTQTANPYPQQLTGEMEKRIELIKDLSLIHI